MAFVAVWGEAPLGEEAEGAGDDIQVLVGQHVSEIEALERHWLTEIEELKERQEVTLGGIMSISAF